MRKIDQFVNESVNDINRVVDGFVKNLASKKLINSVKDVTVVYDESEKDRVSEIQIPLSKIDLDNANLAMDLAMKYPAFKKNTANMFVDGDKSALRILFVDEVNESAVSFADTTIDGFMNKISNDSFTSYCTANNIDISTPEAETIAMTNYVNMCQLINESIDVDGALNALIMFNRTWTETGRIDQLTDEEKTMMRATLEEINAKSGLDYKLIKEMTSLVNYAYSGGEIAELLSNYVNESLDTEKAFFTIVRYFRTYTEKNGYIDELTDEQKTQIRGLIEKINGQSGMDYLTVKKICAIGGVTYVSELADMLLPFVNESKISFDDFLQKFELEASDLPYSSEEFESFIQESLKKSKLDAKIAYQGTSDIYEHMKQVSYKIQLKLDSATSVGTTKHGQKFGTSMAWIDCYLIFVIGAKITTEVLCTYNAAGMITYARTKVSSNKDIEKYFSSIFNEIKVR